MCNYCLPTPAKLILISSVEAGGGPAKLNPFTNNIIQIIQKRKNMYTQALNWERNKAIMLRHF